MYCEMKTINFWLKCNRDVLFEFHLKFLNTTSIGIPEVYYKVDRLLTGLTAQQKETTDSNKTSLQWK